MAFLDRWKEVHGDAWARLLQWGAREDAEEVMGHAVAGTVPFRVRTSVQNIRTIQDLLRRAFPAVTVVRKL